METLLTSNEQKTFLLLIVGVVIAYLLGSIPIAWLLTKWVTGQDLRRLGSGNVGVMNTALSASRWAGVVAFVCEAAKGFLAVTIPRSLHQGEIIVSLIVIAVVVGTRWPIWLGFKGGAAIQPACPPCY